MKRLLKEAFLILLVLAAVLLTVFGIPVFADSALWARFKEWTWDWGGMIGMLAMWFIIFERFAKMTRNKVDDWLLSRIYKVFSFLGWYVPEDKEK